MRGNRGLPPITKLVKVQSAPLTKQFKEREMLTTAIVVGAGFLFCATLYLSNRYH